MGTLRGTRPWLLTMLVLLARPAAADHEAVQLSQTLGGPIVTIPASTMPAGRWSFSSRVEYVRSSALSDQDLLSETSAGHRVHSLEGLLVPSFAMSYGVTDRLTIGTSFPYLMRRGLRGGHMEGTTPVVDDHGDVEGLGDLTVLGQFKFTRDEIQDLALLVGIKVPTGDTERIDEAGTLLHPADQPGSGSWDPLLGLSWTETTTSGSVDANVLARFTTTGKREINLGQLLQFNFGVTYLAFSSRERGEDGNQESTRLHFVGEANLERREPETLAGDDAPNSGSTVIYLSPGLRLSTAGRWGLSLSLGVPVWKETKGKQSESQFRVLGALGIQI